MKTLILISGIAILFFGFMISKNSYEKHKAEKAEMELKKNEVIENIEVLRRLSFFDNYKDLTSLEIYETIYSNRKKRYSKFTKHLFFEIDVGMDLSFEDLTFEDTLRVFHTDLEADVIEGNEVYIWVVESLSKLSKGKFNPINIEEKWKTDSGPIEISFMSNDLEILFEPKYNNDWLDPNIFHVCQQEFAKNNVRIVECLFGDGFTVMRLTKEEQSLIEERLNWKFSDKWKKV